MLETRQELGEAIDSLSDDDDELAPSDPTQLSMEDAARIQANMMLRRLERLEWIDVEVRAQFERFIVGTMTRIRGERHARQPNGSFKIRTMGAD